MSNTVSIKFYLSILVALVLSSLRVFSQDFEFGSVTMDELTMSRYEGDTTASAVVLREFGHASIRNGEGYDLIFKYHVRIKILKKRGLSQSNMEIPLYQQNTNRYEKITSIKASSFNIENGVIREETLLSKNIYDEKRNKYVDVKKFAIPNVRVGSVIEMEYVLESPFIFNFREWTFQSDIPKVRSEYWALIPGVYRYNITLRGYLKLAQNESSIERECLGTSNASYAGGFSADCALMKFGMKDIPAFVDEEYMTARKNFVSSIQFELSEIRHIDGRVDKVTKEWRDAELELRQDNRFGGQLKRGREIGQEVEKLIAGGGDEISKAKKVYDFIRDWYVWNDTYGKYSELGIKKAFDERKGNVGDINLSLVAALRFAGLDAEPVILSTRDNGTVVELHPVLSEFNYVIAKVNIGEKVYLADATDKYYPFGMLPERCLNGKGRVMGEKGSSWIELQSTEPGKTVSVFKLTLKGDGVVEGSLVTTFMGYDAVRKRKEILSFDTHEAYIRDLQNAFRQFEITSFELKNAEDREKSITRSLNIRFQAFDDPETTNFLFNPFLVDRWTENPFKSADRLYPVDFGMTMERTMILSLDYPENYEIVNLPERVGLSLPDAGGRFIFQASNMNNKLSIDNALSIRKTIFTSTEYHYLKELFNRIMQLQNGELIFRKKA